MRKIGISYTDNLLGEDCFAQLHEGGMDAIEICLFREPEKLDYQKLEEYARRYEIALWSCHMPFNGVNSLTQEEPEARKTVMDRYCDLIRRAAQIGVQHVVVHPGSVLEGVDRSESVKQAQDALNTLAEFAHSCGAVIAVENMIVKRLGNTVDELLALVSANDKLRICFDVNHLLLNSHDEFLDKAHDKIATVHISDYDFMEERHWFPGEGKIDWQALYAKLSGYGYDGAWMYELKPGVKNELRSRALTIRDFYNNAMQIFAGERPARI